MPAISKAWVVIADGAVDPDSPLDAALMTGMRDDLVHLREWLGAAYTAGAVQDHNHDGSNSALVEIGPNAIRNGSFEDGTNGWTLTPYTGGSIAINTANDMDGTAALAITSTVLANGGGDIVSNAYNTCSGGDVYAFNAAVKASAANISCNAEILWYDKSKSQISVSTIYSSTNTPISKSRIGNALQSPTNARFYKIKLTGGVPAVGSAIGTVYFDGCVASGLASGGVILAQGTISGVASLNLALASYASFRCLALEIDGALPVTNGVGAMLRTSIDNGATFAAAAFDYNYAYEGKSATGTLQGSASSGNSIFLNDSTSLGNQSNGSFNARIDIRVRNDSVKFTQVRFSTNFTDGGGNSIYTFGGGGRGAAEINNGIQFLFSSGNIAALSYTLIGWN